MASITVGIGKGLRETVSPYRTVYFYGADLNTVDASNWNGPPEIVDPVSVLDLANLPVGKEAIVAMAKVTSAPPGTYDYLLKWYRGGQSFSFFTSVESVSIPTSGYTYAYSYVGRVPTELVSNGPHRVTIDISGPAEGSYELNFEVTGLPESPTPPPEIPELFTKIPQLLESAAVNFDALYLRVNSWVWPFYLAAIEFLVLANLFREAANGFSSLLNWIYNVGQRLGQLVDIGQVTEYLSYWIDQASTAWSWVINAWQNVTGIIELWWATMGATVQGWITAATQGFNQLLADWSYFTATTLPGLTQEIGQLWASWSNFAGSILPTLLSITGLEAWWTGKIADVKAFVESTILAWFPFYNELTSLWSGIRDFFSDPERWVYDRLDSFFERFW